jgi:dTDP-glucose 4,6-dehydratase
VKTILLTGSAGFIGSNFCERIIPDNKRYRFVSLDRLVDPYNIKFIPSNHKFYLGDFTDQHFIDRVMDIEKPDFVIHMGAESFVDKSTEMPARFSHTNVYGTSVLIEASVKHNVKKFHYVSTDEVMGQLGPTDPPWTELDIPAPRNNYSASKYAGELLVRSAYETYGLQYSISRCCNNFGKYQPYRNLVPKVCVALLTGQTIFLQNAGTPIREWISPIDHSYAIMKILEEEEPNQTYNVGSGFECSNSQMVQFISDELNIEPKIDLTTIRPGQDQRYSVNCSKIKQRLGWEPQNLFKETLVEACSWYRENLHLFT